MSHKQCCSCRALVCTQPLCVCVCVCVCLLVDVHEETPVSTPHQQQQEQQQHADDDDDDDDDAVIETVSVESVSAAL